MKSLSNIEKFKLSEDLKNIIGGQVSGSFDANGSKFTYCGDLSQTCLGDVSLSGGVSGNGVTLGVGVSKNITTTDFCGKATYDGVEKQDCAQYLKGQGWVVMS